MKLIGESITVQSQPAGQGRIEITSLFWRRKLYRVQVVLAVWRWRGYWWTTPRLTGRERIYYQVLCATPDGSELQMEVFQERGRWTLSRVLD